MNNLLQEKIETRLINKIKKVGTSRSFVNQKFNDVKRSEINPISVSVYIDNREGKDALKTLKEFNKKVFEAFYKFDNIEQDFQYVIIDGKTPEFNALKRVGNTQFFIRVEEVERINTNIEVDEDTPAGIIKALEELKEDENRATYQRGLSSNIFRVDVFVFKKV